MNPAAADHRVWSTPYLAFDAVRGTLSITSTPEAGTLVRLSVPLVDDVEGRPGDAELASTEVTS